MAIKMHCLSPKVATLLASEGWAPGRRVDILSASDQLECRGISVSSAAAAFLSEFEGLTIHTRGGLFHLGTQDCATHLLDDDIPFLRRITGEPLCPVGHGLFLWLLISATGDFILLNSHWQRYLRCHDLNDALELLFVPETPRRPFVELEPECWPPGYQPIDD